MHLIFSFAEKIATDFQNEELNKVWKGVQVSILERRNQRETAMKASMEDHQNTTEQQRQIMAARHAELDDRIKSLESQFTTHLSELEQNTKIFVDELDTSVKEKNLPCLGPRAHWLDCHKKYSLDVRPCDAYLATLEKCVNEAVVNKRI